MDWRKIKNSWLLSNKHYLIPVFLFAAAVNVAVGLVFAVIALVIWGFNKLRARLPIDSGLPGEAETMIYREIDGTELKLDIWRPTGGRSVVPPSGTATIVFAHGGGWISGLRNQPNIVSWCRFLANRGFFGGVN